MTSEGHRRDQQPSSGSSRGDASSATRAWRLPPCRCGGLAEILSEQGASAATYKRNSDNVAFFASHPKYKFVMVNHVTTNSFFTATIYGMPGRLRPDRLLVPVDRLGDLGRLRRWSRRSTPRIAAQGERHRVLPDRQHRLQRPGRQRAEPRHPRDRVQRRRRRRGSRTTGWPTSARTTSPRAPRSRRQILKHRGRKGDLVAGIIATPGTGNIQPRIDGAKPVLTKAGRRLRRGRDLGDRGRAGVQQDLLVVRRPQGREVHVRPWTAVTATRSRSSSRRTS